MKTDAKRFHDGRPGVRRTIEGMEPMELVFGDVHHGDILVRRDDGSIATLKMIAWLDVATQRVWIDAVLLEKGKGVTQAHVGASLTRMMLAWGVPGRLYVDNGKEYGFTHLLDDVLKLRRFGLVDAGDRSSGTTYALPYNGRAKPIEAVFANLEKNHFRQIPGWIGGERMRKKTANVGREPEPFPGTASLAGDFVAAMVAIYHRLPQKRGQLKGRSPDQAYADALAAGWTMTAIDPDALLWAFSEEKSRRVQRGCIQHKGEVYTCPELQAYLGEHVSIRVPKFGEWSRLPVCDNRGELIGYAEPDRPYRYLDTAGALESKTRADRKRRAVMALDRSVPDVSPLAERLKLIPTEDMPAAVVATIGATGQVEQIAAGLAESQLERDMRRMRERNDELAELIALDKQRNANLLKYGGF